MLRYSHPWLEFILDYWPATVFLPSVLLLVAALALFTRWWDRRDASAVQEPPAHQPDLHVEAINLFDPAPSTDRATAA
jgi:hypothetical protein